MTALLMRVLAAGDRAREVSRAPSPHTARRMIAMPMYDYKCLDCGKESLIAMTLKEHESGTVTCHACGSKKMDQMITSFIARTTKKS